MIRPEPAVLALCAALAGGGLLWAGWSDLRRYLIPNRACATVILGFLAAGFVLPSATWLAGLLTGTVVLGGGAALFAAGRIGGGDAKLAAATALWAGPTYLGDFALATSLAGAALAAVMLSPLRALMPAAPAGSDAGSLRQPMPFGLPLAAGGLWVLSLNLASSL